jgi:uncharacterized protein YyaL (SSP411 family)
MADFVMARGAGNGVTEGGRSLEMATATLRAMALGGIHDQIGGGFHRYATDAKWHVPHFEKMLYDNAQLIVNYTEAYRITGDAFFLAVARRTADYVMRDMTHPEGGFFSAEDADSLIPEGDDTRKAEGAFYVWTVNEVEALLDDEAAKVFAHRYGMLPGGNAETDPFGEFKGKNILFVATIPAETARMSGQTAAAVEETLAAARKKLFTARSQRPRPQLDDKVLSSWNGLMISALAKLYQASGDDRYLKGARDAAGFIRNRLYEAENRRLYRRWRDGQRKVDGIASDYANMAQGAIDLYESDFDPKWLNWAADLTDALLDAFYDADGGGFFMTRYDHDKNLILRVKAGTDNVLPSAASVAVFNLLRLSRLIDNKAYAAAAEQTLRAAYPDLEKHPTGAPQMLVALAYHMAPPVQVVIAGPGRAGGTLAMLDAVRSAPITGKSVTVVSDEDTRKSLAKIRPFLENIPMVDGKPTAYVCTETGCKAPVTDPADLTRLLDAVCSDR